MELLIVIVIIGILAVAFLPTLLGAPAKGRDTQRIADLQKIQKVLVNANLEGALYPNTDGSIVDALVANVDSDTWADLFLTGFGGALPTDPQEDNTLPVTTYTEATAGTYWYEYQPGDYAFGLVAHVELFGNANTTCTAAKTGTLTAPEEGVTTDAELCYAIFTE